MSILTIAKTRLQDILPALEEEKIEPKVRVYPKMMGREHYPPPAQLECRENLQKLAAYLLALPEGYREFNMGQWFGRSKLARQGWKKRHNPVCGTAACAAGHGPAAGIEPRDRETWDDYAHRLAGHDHRLRDFLFSGFWHGTDDTPHGAAKRIEYALAHGTPKEFWMFQDQITNHLKDVEV